MIFLICSILGSIELQIGLALGLFAIFAIIRFRTVAFSVKDMTYMFTIIGISIINSQANIPPPLLGAVIVNVTIIVLTWSLEKFLLSKMMERRSITIKKLELLKPENKAELLKELSIMTGQNIIRVNIEKMDFDRKRADLEVFFREERLRYENPQETIYNDAIPRENLKREPEKNKKISHN
jgi:multisubunit Na+/H+ antiporter MnhG subunit